jgi:hypothetical protein
VTDAITGKPYISEQPNGFHVNCVSLTWEGDVRTGTQSFWGKADGTYNNDKIFAGTYRVYIANGAFHSGRVDTLEVRSKKVTVNDFTVTPYVSFSDVSIAKDPNAADGIIATFTLRTNPVYGDDGTVSIAATIRDYFVFATKRSSKVGVNIYDSDVSVAQVRLTEEQLGIPITVRKRGFTPGTYYIRVGARCDESPDARYNMTEIVEMKF